MDTPRQGFKKRWFRKYHYKHWKKHLAYLDGKPARYLEIGVLEARSFCWVMNNLLRHPKARGYGIDLWPDDIEGWPGSVGDEIYETALENTRKYGDKVKLFRMSSLDIKKLKLEPMDLIYIDGCHEPGVVAIDSGNSWDLLKVGGVIVWDDYHSRPRSVIHQFVESLGKHGEVVFDTDLQIAVRRLK